ncbi:Rrf2 family transcriptional regulator [Myxococcota bacterium]|nr:Rrf2 family transcriptional regulator [Myxococcota bacterium]
MISQTAEYALRAVACLAASRGTPKTTQQIAEVTRVPSGYLAKVLQALGRADLVHSQRGVGGGFVLMRPPKEISVLEVIEAVEPIQRIRSCPLGIAEHGTRLCTLHRQLDEAMAKVEAAFSRTTMEKILADRNPSKPLCQTPIAALVED